jgi:lipoic acid synthetase
VVLAPEGRRLLRLEARNSQTPIEKKPPWIKTRLRTGPEYTALKGLVQREGLHTVCQEAGCPNIFECWEDREATFLIGGDQCTRRCHREAGAAGHRRAEPGSRVGGHHGPALRHGDRGGPG